MQRQTKTKFMVILAVTCKYVGRLIGYRHVTHVPFTHKYTFFCVFKISKIRRMISILLRT